MRRSSNRFFVRLDCFGSAANAREGVSQICMRPGKIRRSGNCSPNEIDGNFRATDLGRDDPEMMQSGAVTGLSSQHLAINRLRFRETTRLVVSNGSLKC